MKRVYVCGSFRFIGEIEKLEMMLRKANIESLISKNMDVCGILGCLRKIDQADIIYVVNPDGYIGKSVSVDIGYAYAKNKPIYVMRPIDDPPVMNMVNGTISFEELIILLKNSESLKGTQP